MRFEEIRAVAPYANKGAGRAFEGQRVLAVLPVCEEGCEDRALLVATPRKLGIATLRLVGKRRRWVTRWAPWDAVHLEGSGETSGAASIQAVVEVGGHHFRGILEGAPGRSALRDFARTLRARRRALSLPSTA